MYSLVRFDCTYVRTYVHTSIYVRMLVLPGNFLSRYIAHAITSIFCALIFESFDCIVPVLLNY